MFILEQITMLSRQPSIKYSARSVFNFAFERITMPSALSPGVDLSPESCQSVLWRVASSTRTLTCFTAEQQRESKEGKGWDGSGGKRKRENRTQNSICSGLDGSFFSLERTALNPICASCQLCPRVPCGAEQNGKWLTGLEWVRSGLDRTDPCWDGLHLAQEGSRIDVKH